MGHAGAIISGGSGTAAEKMAAFAAAGVPVARIPSEIPALIAEALDRRRGRAARATAAARSVRPAARGARARNGAAPRLRAARSATRRAARGPAKQQSRPSRAAPKTRARRSER